MQAPIIIVILALMVVVAADIGLDSRYKLPQTSYGVPSHQYVGASSGYNTGYSGASRIGAVGLSGQSPYSSGYNYQAPSSNIGYQSAQQFSDLQSRYQSGSGQQGTGFTGGSGYQATNSNYQSGAGYQSGGAIANNGYKFSGSQSAAVQQPSYQHQNSYQSSNQYQTSVAQQYQEQYKQAQQQPAQVFKHFYVHAAPEEPEMPSFRQPPTFAPPQKHYKIIFIKTPTHYAAAPQYLPTPQQNEEKTIVYVLVKKPDEVQDIVLPKIEQKPPTKPEVYFIKYNSKESSQGVINNIVSDYSKDGTGYSGGVSSSSSNVYSGSTESSVNAQSYESVVAQHVANNQAGNSVSIDDSSSGILPLGTSGESSEQNQEASVTSLRSGAVGGAYESNVGSSGEAASDAVAQSGHSSGESQNLESFNTISSSLGTPHESYGPPMFRLQ